ncbi:12340_t:CDS:2 [Cetraspora pellucida]|uniref:12340_t:CDS:1 n=1 Tax=Cetraspora pellucida TaxID=1433469 RepID=A0A9N9DMM6_9GLOM|nr:12340_t:CDS:2 [Cetraspora pellucida]
MGTIVDIVYKLEKIPPALSTLVLFKMNNYTGPTFSISDSSEVTIIIHKLQGLTLSQAVIDIGDKEFVLGLIFVEG